MVSILLSSESPFIPILSVQALTDPLFCIYLQEEVGMARTAARLTDGTRITDFISLGVVAKTFPKSLVEEVLVRFGKASERQRDLEVLH